MSRVRLPRGAENAYAPFTAATTRWADAGEIARYPHRDTGFYLGAEMHVPDTARPVAERLAALIGELGRAERIDLSWRQSQMETAQAHLRSLHTAPTLIGIDNDMHVITCAGTRGGKGTTTIIPNLIRYRGSVICIDPKGENARATAARRGAGDRHCKGLGQRVHVLDPYGVSGIDKASLAQWNPLDFIDLDSAEVYDQAASVAEAIMVRGDRDAHWDDSATTFIKALILYVKVTRCGQPDCNLLTVRRLAMQGIRAEPEPDPAAELLDISPTRALLLRMEGTEDPADVISAAASTLLDMGERELGSVLSTARRNLEFLEKTGIARTVERSSFSLDELKTAKEGATIYLCLPPQHMLKVGRWLRLMIGLTMERMYALPARPERPSVLFILEEFHILGHMPVIETAIAFAAGLGVKFHIILQDINQLKRHYPKSWETFIGNAGVLQVFACNDTTTLSYIAKRIGDIEITQTTRSFTSSQTVSTNDASTGERMNLLFANRGSFSAFVNPLTAFSDHTKASHSAASNASQNEAQKVTQLIRPEEIERVFRRDAMAALVIIAGEPPMCLSRLNYFDAAPFEGQFTPIEAPRSPPPPKRDPLEAATAFERNCRAAMEAALKPGKK
jgi:type IV secretion system protein VirD4